MARRRARPRADKSTSRIRISRSRKQEAVHSLLRGDDVATVAQSLGVSPATLEIWKRQMLAQLGGAQAPPVASANAEQSRTSQRVLHAAVREFGERGLAGARIDAIAAQAGVNKTAIYYHFGNKDDLFAAALEFGYAQFGLRDAARAGASDDPIGDLRNWIGALFDRVLTNRLHASLIADENRHGGKHLSAAVRARVRGLIAPVISELAALVERGQAAGTLRPDIDVPRTYLAIVSMSMFHLTNATTLAVTVGIDLLDRKQIRLWRKQVIEFAVAAMTRSR
jgi:TetR/AcrR family transcriptional regulator